MADSNSIITTTYSPRNWKSAIQSRSDSSAAGIPRSSSSPTIPPEHILGEGHKVPIKDIDSMRVKTSRVEGAVNFVAEIVTRTAVTILGTVALFQVIVTLA